MTSNALPQEVVLAIERVLELVPRVDRSVDIEPTEVDVHYMLHHATILW